jgi:large subunit ribosomal protein L31
MKTGIHPEYTETTVTCSCGNTFTTRSTTDSIRVELCNECHPFYTGRQKLVDSGGRVERYKQRMAKSQAKQAEAQKTEEAKKS